MKARWLFLLLVMVALGAAGGCASTEGDVSSIPWNRPQPWEGTGALGGMPIRGNTGY